MKRQLTFTKEERVAIADHCKAMGITFEEFIHTATMQAVDEVNGYGIHIGSIKRLCENDDKGETK
jgi:hypothetical protein